MRAVKTNPAARRPLAFALSVLALLASAACNAVSPSPALRRPSRNDPHAPTPAATPTSLPEDGRARFSVSYTPAGNVVVLTSTPPEIVRLPSGLFRITFDRSRAQDVASARP
jgi:hypothetical protein